MIKLALDFKVTKRLLNQIEGYYHKEIRSSRLVLQCDHEDPYKMSFYEPYTEKTESEGRTLDDISKIDDTSVIVNNELPILKSPPRSYKKKMVGLRKSLLGLLSNENLQNKISDFREKQSPYKNKSLQAFHLSTPHAEKNSKTNDSQNLEAEDSHNMSQSTETQTHFLSNNGMSNFASVNSPSTMLWQKLEDFNVSEAKKSIEHNEDIPNRLGSPTHKIDLIDSDVTPLKIPQFEKLKQVLGAKNYHSRNRSNSYNSDFALSKPFKLNITTPYPVVTGSESPSFLTDKPEEADNGYFDDHIKEELQRETDVFTPKVNTPSRLFF